MYLLLSTYNLHLFKVFESILKKKTKKTQVHFVILAIFIFEGFFSNFFPVKTTIDKYQPILAAQPSSKMVGKI